jgi:hypothetical protein
MITTLRVSLYKYLHLKLAKTLCLSYYLLSFLFNKTGEQEGRTEQVLPGRRLGGQQYTHVNKCKNNKIKTK